MNDEIAPARPPSVSSASRARPRCPRWIHRRVITQEHPLETPASRARHPIPRPPHSPSRASRFAAPARVDRARDRRRTMLSSRGAVRAPSARAHVARGRVNARAPAARRPRGVVTRASDATDDEIEFLEKALKLAKSRKGASGGGASAGAGAGSYTGASFNVKTFNAISPVGLGKFPPGKYAVSGDDGALPGDPMAIMLRSHKLQVSEVGPTVRGIVRCGAGTNNIPTKEMSERGIPVFNTPGANANAVKELVVCSLLLSSRGILEGNRHVNEVINVEENGDYAKISSRIEKDKAMFGGMEIEGKTLGVIGLGAIGSRCVIRTLTSVYAATRSSRETASRFARSAFKGMMILN